ncbi:MAG: MFS transporter [Acidobacteriaceae bacterium]
MPQLLRLSRAAQCRVVALLGVSVLINYVDRGNLSLAAPLLQRELHISAAQLGWLFAAFFWTYTIAMFFSGWLLDRVDVKWVLLAGFVAWSLATSLTGFVYGFYALIAVRMLLGMGESVAFPSCARFLASQVSQEYRGIANAVIITSMSLGPAVGTYGCGMWIAHSGWRPVFIILGLLSLLWVVPWLRWMPRSTSAQNSSSSTVPTTTILRQRTFWAAACGQLCSNYPFYFMISWLPFYLVRERHLSMRSMTNEATLFFLTFAATAPVIAFIADSCIRAGYSVNVVRKTSIGVGHIMIALTVLGCAAPDPRVSLASLIVMGAACGFVSPNVYVFAQTLAGPSAAAKWTGFQNGVANFAGVIVGPLSGFIVDRTGHFWWAFVVCAAAAAIGTFFWLVLVGPLQEVQWAAPAHMTKKAGAP